MNKLVCLCEFKRRFPARRRSFFTEGITHCEHVGGPPRLCETLRAPMAGTVFAGTGTEYKSVLIEPIWWPKVCSTYCCGVRQYASSLYSHRRPQNRDAVHRTVAESHMRPCRPRRQRARAQSESTPKATPPLDRPETGKNLPRLSLGRANPARRQYLRGVCGTRTAPSSTFPRGEFRRRCQNHPAMGAWRRYRFGAN